MTLTRRREYGPVRVGFVVRTFTFGGSETDALELVHAADPSRLRFSGVAVTHPLPLPEGVPPADGPFPPLFMQGNPYIVSHDPRVRMCADTSAAVNAVASASDVLVTWGEPDIWRYLPAGR